MLRSICAMLFVAAFATGAAAQGQRKLTPAPKLRLPPYGENVPELTAERLDDLERRLRESPDPAAEKEKQDQADAAAREWRQCQAGVKASFKPRAQQQERQDNAQIEATAADRQRLAAETEKRLKSAKTPEEMQRIAQEMTAKMQTLAPSGAPTQQLNRDYQRQLAAKCGAEPARVTASAPGGYPGAPRTFPLIIERAAGFCRERPSYVGPDGSLSTSDTPFDRRDKGAAMHYNVEVYSPREAAQLEPRCARLVPLLKSRGHM